MDARRRHATHRSRSRRGATLVEALTAAFILSLLLTAMSALAFSVMFSRDKQNTQNGLNGGARLAMDETLAQLRGAAKVADSDTLGGRSYSTTASSVVLTAPGYDPAQSSVILTGVTDKVALRFDSSTKKLTETIQPGTGSTRPARTDYVLAENVDSVEFTYRVREAFTATTAGTATFTLKTAAAAAPTTATVYNPDGTSATASCVYSPTTNTATVASTALIRGSSVQLVYPVTPSGSVVDQVSEVDVVLTLAQNDRRSIRRSTKLQGGACLRNRRL